MPQTEKSTMSFAQRMARAKGLDKRKAFDELIAQYPREFAGYCVKLSKTYAEGTMALLRVMQRYSLAHVEEVLRSVKVNQKRTYKRRKTPSSSAVEVYVSPKPLTTQFHRKIELFKLKRSLDTLKMTELRKIGAQFGAKARSKAVLIAKIEEILNAKIAEMSFKASVDSKIEHVEEPSFDQMPRTSLAREALARADGEIMGSHEAIISSLQYSKEGLFLSAGVFSQNPDIALWGAYKNTGRRAPTHRKSRVIGVSLYQIKVLENLGANFTVLTLTRKKNPSAGMYVEDAKLMGLTAADLRFFINIETAVSSEFLLQYGAISGDPVARESPKDPYWGEPCSYIEPIFEETADLKQLSREVRSLRLQVNTVKEILNGGEFGNSKSRLSTARLAEIKKSIRTACGSRFNNALKYIRGVSSGVKYLEAIVSSLLSELSTKSALVKGKKSHAYTKGFKVNTFEAEKGRREFRAFVGDLGSLKEKRVNSLKIGKKRTTSLKPTLAFAQLGEGMGQLKSFLEGFKSKLEETTYKRVLSITRFGALRGGLSFRGLATIGVRFAENGTPSRFLRALIKTWENDYATPTFEYPNVPKPFMHALLEGLVRERFLARTEKFQFFLAPRDLSHELEQARLALRSVTRTLKVFHGPRRVNGRITWFLCVIGNPIESSTYIRQLPRILTPAFANVSALAEKPKKGNVDPLHNLPAELPEVEDRAF